MNFINQIKFDISFIQSLTSDLIENRIPLQKVDGTKVQFCDADGTVKLTIGKKEFSYVDDHSIFNEEWMHEYDKELQPFQDILYEFPLTFSPSYPFEEDPQMPHNYMSTRLVK
jgi:inositol polyphosphate 5-phosphatase INPP5A